MKTRLLGALVGLALSFALSTFAQQRDSVDPQTLEQLKAFGKKWKEAYENNDAAAVAALFTEDAVLVINTGPIYGREAIEKFYADLFQKWRVSNLISHWDQYCPHFYRNGWRSTLEQWGSLSDVSRPEWRTRPTQELLVKHYGS